MTDTPSKAPGRLREATAEEIKVLLVRRGMSAAELARRTGIKQAYISRRMTGEIPFDLDDLELIAAVLEVPIADLLPPEAKEYTGIDVEVIRSRPLRSRPTRHGRTVTRAGGVQPTDEYATRTIRPTSIRPTGRPPNRPGTRGPKGRPPKPIPNPTTRRPARIPSPAVNPNGSQRSHSGAGERDLRPMSSIMPASAGSPA